MTVGDQWERRSHVIGQGKDSRPLYPSFSLPLCQDKDSRPLYFYSLVDMKRSFCTAAVRSIIALFTKDEDTAVRTGESITVGVSPFAPRKQRCFRGAKGDTCFLAGPNRSRVLLKVVRFSRPSIVKGGERRVNVRRRSIAHSHIAVSCAEEAGQPVGDQLQGRVSELVSRLGIFQFRGTWAGLGNGRGTASAGNGVAKGPEGDRGVVCLGGATAGGRDCAAAAHRLTDETCGQQPTVSEGGQRLGSHVLVVCGMFSIMCFWEGVVQTKNCTNSLGGTSHSRCCWVCWRHDGWGSMGVPIACAWPG